MFGAAVNSREQGDIGERAAAAWLLQQDAIVAYPFGQQPDWDLIAEIDFCLYKVQVKTSTCFRRGRWEVTLCTRGGNQSWNGLVKRLDSSRYDYLFVVVGDGRQWFIPSDCLRSGSGVRLGGPKYERFEVEPAEPLVDRMRRQAARTKIFVSRRDTQAVNGTRL